MSASISKIEGAFAQMSRSWSWTLANGIVSVLFGVAVLFWPRETLRVVATLFALQLIAASLFRFAVTFLRTGESVVHQLQMAALASFALVVGLALLEDMRLSLHFLVIVLGVYWGSHGVIELAEAITHSCRTDRLWVVASGVMGVVVGLILVLAGAVPSLLHVHGAQLLLVARTLGVWLVLFGVMLLVRAFRVRFEEAAAGAASGGLRPAGT